MFLFQAQESSVSNVLSPRYESLIEDRPWTPSQLLLTTDPLPVSTTPSSTPGPKKRVTIADYKKRKQAYRTDSIDECSERPLDTVLNTLASTSPVTTLPELPGLETRRSKPVSPVFEKKNRSISPLTEMKTKSSPNLTERRTRSSPQIFENKVRTSSPGFEKKQKSGSPAKLKDRTASPRKIGSSLPRQEKWESKPKEPLNKGIRFICIFTYA